MRIGIINPHFGHIFGGAEVNDLNLGSALSGMGHTVTYFFAQGDNAELVEHISRLKIEPVRMHYWYEQSFRFKGLPGKLMRHLFESFFLRRLVQQKSASLMKQDLLLLTGRPLLSKVKRFTSSCVLQSIRGVPNSRYFKYYDEADGIIFWGGCEAQHPQSRLRNLSYLTLDAALEADLFYPAPPDPLLRRQLQGDSENNVVIISTNRLHPIQQVEEIIAACSTLQSRGFSLRLIIVGDGQSRAMLEHLAGAQLDSGSYEFLGRKPRPEMGELLRASDIFVMNPKFTSYSIALKEALTCETYAIAPLTGKVAHSITEQDFAETFPPNDRAAFTDCMLRALKDKRYLNSASKTHDKRPHTWNEVAANIVSWHSQHACENNK